MAKKVSQVDLSSSPNLHLIKPILVSPYTSLHIVSKLEQPTFSSIRTKTFVALYRAPTHASVFLTFTMFLKSSRALILALFATSSLLVLSSTERDRDQSRYRRLDRETTYGDTSREMVLESRERRKRQLKNMVTDARRKLADHSAGEITLTPEMKKQLEDQMDIFQRKLDTMQVDLQEWVCRQNDRARELHLNSKSML